MNVSKLAVSLALLSSCYAHSAEHTITFGGWSKHSTQSYELKAIKYHFGPTADFNETHKGIGYKFSTESRHRNISFIAETFFMKDSFNQPMQTYGIGAEYTYPLYTIGIRDIRFSIPISYVRRSKLNRSLISDDCNSGQVECYTYALVDQNFIAPIPYVGLTTSAGLGLDFSLLPMPTFEGYGYVAFSRLHFRF
tara:strand:+ start:673 stop:1254 length:582 start_codon:yes stop_codon:yes gene_type:complete